ncbi:MAG: prepilin peptidase [Lentisphaeria bacterium]|nr:prepilin peptidase [Lentisphaeria bacterium]
MNYSLYENFYSNPQAYWFWFAVVFVVGCCMGSFLNVCIWRMPLGESVITAPSHCPKCGHQIRWYENIPLVSFLCLRARCSGCKQPITWRYFIVELLTGILFAIAYAAITYKNMYFSFIIPAGAMIMLAVASSFIDVEHRIIPDALNFPAMITGIIFWGVECALGDWNWRLFIAVLVCGFAAWGFFYLFSWLGEKFFKTDALGQGDVKFLAAAAFLFGPAMFIEYFIGLLVASLSGFLFGAGYCLIKKQSLRNCTIPFGPFLAFGMVLAMFIPNLN